MNSERITLLMTVQDAIIALCEGNPGALNVCIRMCQEGAAIDPDSGPAGVAGLLMLDSLGIYGSRIWLLYKDVCGEDLTKTMAVLKALQLGIIGEYKVAQALCGQNDLDMEAILLQVRAELPRFGRVEPVVAEREKASP